MDNLTTGFEYNESAATEYESSRDFGGRADYQAEVAHRQAVERRRESRAGRCHIAEHPPLRAEVHARLERGWSPEEIAGSLRRDYPELPAMHTSHESIHRYVYVLARGELKRELVACPRRHHAARRPLRRGIASTQGRLKDMVLVDERPPEVETRLSRGHHEGDLILGAGNRSAVGVLVERTTRDTFLCQHALKTMGKPSAPICRPCIPSPFACDYARR